MKRTVSFVDKNKSKFTVEIELTDGKLSMTGQYGGGCGQCQDSIVPATSAQAELVQLWNDWHLNDMHAGTKLQRTVTKDAKTYEESLVALIQHGADGTKMSENDAAIYREMWEDFNRGELPDFTGGGQLEILSRVNRMTDEERAEFFYFNIITRYGGNEMVLFDKSKGETIKERAEFWLFGKTLLYDNGYRYGTAWLKDELPDDIEEQIYTIVDQIEEDEKERKDGQLVSDMDEDELDEWIKEHAGELPGWATEHGLELPDCRVAVALAKMLDLCVNELDDIENEYDNNWTVQGTSYLAGDDEDMDKEWDASLQNFLEECVLCELKGAARDYFDEEGWKEDAKTDGRGHSLNNYDGGELEADVRGETYYAYQQ